MKYVANGNWHVREGAVHLIAHCIISQGTTKPTPAQAN